MAKDAALGTAATASSAADAGPAPGSLGLERAEDKPTYSRSALAVLVLAAGFALIPRMTHGCEGASLDEDAPSFEGRLVANADALPPLAPVATAAASDADASAASPASPAHALGAGGARDRIDLASLKGHPVILDFWATWCGPCQAESPIVNTIARRYKDRGLAVVGVNTSDEDGLAAAYVKKKGLSFPMLYDENNTIAKKFGVTSLPTLVVISKTGKIVAIRNGLTSDGALDEIVRRYL